jgi:Kef-type K+ transport system membrane component KefB
MSTEILLIILLIGTTIVLALLVKSGLESVGLPSLVGYLALGLFIRLADSQWGLLSIEAQEAYELLSDIGIICLLFEVGLKSNLAGLIRQLRHASIIWISNILFSGVLGYAASYFILNISWIPSLFISVALTATSVGVAVALWREANALRSPDGELVIDVAELDDLSGIILMAMLFAVAPVFKEGIETLLFPGLAQASGMLLSKLVIFAAFCLLFSRYIEHPITMFFQRIEPPPDSMIMIAGIGFIIAALAGLLGFSIAIGAFFAGLIYSRDPQAVKMETSFMPLFEFFTPFFFIGVGLEIDLSTLTSALGLGAVLLIVAIMGKLIGTCLPAVPAVGWTNALLIGISMIPRAEIAMVIIRRGRMLGEWAVPAHVFSAMVVVSFATCIISPMVLRAALRRWPQKELQETG